jgi:hypothetical protein
VPCVVIVLQRECLLVFGQLVWHEGEMNEVMQHFFFCCVTVYIQIIMGLMCGIVGKYGY